MTLVQASTARGDSRTTAVQVTPRLSLRTKIAYGIGECANSMKGTLFGLFVFFFYTSVMGLPGTLVGLASGIGLIWDAVIDPYIGYASDRTFGRLGRRHPFMLAGALSLGLAFWTLFSPPPGLPTGLLFGWFLVTTLLARSTNSIFLVPYYALGAELCSDYYERTELTSIRGACGQIGSLGAATLSFVLFFPGGVSGEGAHTGHGGYAALGMTFGLVMSAAALIATVATLRVRSQLHHRDAGATLPMFNAMAADRSIAMRNRSFRRLFASFTLVFLGYAISAVFSLHFLTYYVMIVDGNVLGTVQAVLFGGSLLGIPLWLRVARVIEKHWAYFVATVITALLMMSAYFLIGPGRPFGTGDARPLLVFSLMAGIAGSVFWMIPASMLADIVDESALASGKRLEGTFFGIYSFGQQLATGVSVVAAGVLVDRFAHLVPGQAIQSALTIERIGILYSLLPAGLLLIGATLILGYALDRQRVAAIQQQLAQEDIKA